MDLLALKCNTMFRNELFFPIYCEFTHDAFNIFCCCFVDKNRTILRMRVENKDKECWNKKDIKVSWDLTCDSFLCEFYAALPMYI